MNKKSNNKNEIWWPLLLFMFCETDMADRITDQIKELKTIRAFKEDAINCQYLELYNDGHCTERICHHPSRDNPCNWIMCNMYLCPNIGSDLIKDDVND